jgi:DNA-binding NarL/FixJ family response regulator
VTIRVLLADDQPLVRAGLAMLIGAEPDLQVVAEVGDGEQAVAAVRDLHPDVVVMDVRMPVMDGVQATRVITQDRAESSCPGIVKVIILTTYHVDEAVYAALRAGASGFLLKDAAADELASAIRAVNAGDAWLDPPVARRLLIDFASRPERLAPPPAVMEQLTAREREVLVLVAHGFSNTEIADRLVVSLATVKTHFGRILLKLGLRDRAQAVAVAYQSGLVRPEESPPTAR